MRARYRRRIDGRAGALDALARRFAAGTRVGRQDELEAGRVGGGAGRTVDDQLAALQGLPEGVKHPAFVFRRLVEEQHAAVRAGRGARAGAAPTRRR